MSTSLQKIKIITVMIAVTVSVLTGCGGTRAKLAQPENKAPVEAPAQAAQQDTGSAAEPVKAPAEVGCVPKFRRVLVWGER